MESEFDLYNWINVPTKYWFPSRDNLVRFETYAYFKDIGKDIIVPRRHLLKRYGSKPKEEYYILNDNPKTLILTCINFGIELVDMKEKILWDLNGKRYHGM